MWSFKGQKRPDFAEQPADGQESVWDYPRPPALRQDHRHVVIRGADGIIVDTERSIRVCETASPPTFYFHPDDVHLNRLVPCSGTSFCEWKGAATYWALASAPGQAVGWTYASPTRTFADIAGHFAFYPDRVECTVDGERVRAQAGGFYGGWVTSDIVGPFKGDPGTGHW